MKIEDPTESDELSMNAFLEYSEKNIEFIFIDKYGKIINSTRKLKILFFVIDDKSNNFFFFK